MKIALKNFDDKTIIPRKRGSKGGALHRLRKRFSRPPLPSVVLSNVQSLPNKLDELRVLCRFDSVYREACLLGLSETWLNDDVDNDVVSINGFSILRSDRTRTESGKNGGGGVCLYVNNRWCTEFTVHERTCTPLFDLLCVSLRPHYLPREFTKIVVCVAYIPLFSPSERTREAARAIAASVSALHPRRLAAP
jgi:ribosome assembly protein 1